MSMIAQRFPAEATFPDGFEYRLLPFVSSGTVTPAPGRHTGEACLHIRPEGQALQGHLVVGIATTLSEGGIAGTRKRLREMLGDGAAGRIAAWRQATLAQAAEFWSKSAVRIADPFLENLWYETLHAQRAVFRGGTVPPGLFLPSTLNDYSHWHRDYHTNYNIQQPFLGALATNHPEIMEAYFAACDYLIEIGRKIARDYYHCRGTFIQLVGFPIKHLDDPYGNNPISRMVYMTDWMTHHYWRYFLCTQDRHFLKARGYPFLRDAALFYTDFLQKGEDGLYHAFPSVGGEDPLTGDPEDSRDRGQNMWHIRTCLRNAIEAGEILGVDAAFRAEWRDRLEHLAPDNPRDAVPPGRLTPLEEWNLRCTDREVLHYNSSECVLRSPTMADLRREGGSWYLGSFLFVLCGRVRSGKFVAERDFADYRQLMRHWRHPNGLYWAMAIEIYGHAGAWTETLGVTEPLNEMLLRSYNRIIHLFPNWPRDIEAAFRQFRVEGAFLVSAAWKDGAVQTVEVASEKGLDCRLIAPWERGFRVSDEAGRPVTVTPEPESVFRFPTRPGGRYRLHPAAGTPLRRVPCVVPGRKPGPAERRQPEGNTI